MENKIIKFNEFVFEDINDFKNEIDNTDNTTGVLAKNKLTSYTKKLSYYNSNKSKIDNLIKNNTADEDISNALSKIIGDNEFLSKYLSIANLDQTLTNYENKIDDTNNDIKEKQQSGLATANAMKDPTLRAESIKNTTDSINNLKDKISDYNSKLQDISKEISLKKAELDKFIKETKKKIDDDIKKISKK
jgi:hypothetical protein